MDEYQYRKDVREVLIHSQESYQEADRLLEGSSLELQQHDDRSTSGIVWSSGLRPRSSKGSRA